MTTPISTLRRWVIGGIAALWLTPMTAMAAPQDAAAVSGDVTVVSEYISRGLRQSWGQPALQGTVQGSIDGLYGSAFGSSVSPKYWAGTSTEWDLDLGYRYPFSIDDTQVTADAGVGHYFYPGGNFDATSTQVGTFPSHGYDTSELYASADAGGFAAKVYWSLSDYYGYDSDTAPVATWNSGVTGGVYAGYDTRGSTYVDLSWQSPRWSGSGLALHAGRQWVAHSEHLNYCDYKVAIDHVFGAWTALLAITGTRGAGIYADYLSADGDGKTDTIGATRLSASISRAF